MTSYRRRISIRCLQEDQLGSLKVARSRGRLVSLRTHVQQAKDVHYHRSLIGIPIDPLAPLSIEYPFPPEQFAGVNDPVVCRQGNKIKLKASSYYFRTLNSGDGEILISQRLRFPRTLRAIQGE